VATRREVEKMAEKALKALPKRFLEKLDNVEICVRSYPGPEAGRWKGSRTLLGLFLTNPPFPARILLYQRNLEKAGELEEQVAITVRHEIGHYFGFTDAALRRLGH
jgi:predicted Zn-dependent protease with MMP-like domain